VAATSAPSDERAAYGDAQDFAHTGPGTLAGRYLRTFWQPVSLSRDLAPGQAKPLRILHEDFTLYRAEDGQPHVVAPRCAHRGTQLSTGWVEGDCIRCFYHGWKYDAAGQCVEMPAEDASFPPKVRIKSYPTEEYLGLIFAYLGEDEPPPLPRYPYYEEAADTLVVGSRIKPYNYFNEVENSVDPVHVAFVHRDSEFTESGLIGVPRVTAAETEFGLEVRAARPDGSVRVTYLEMPTVLHIKIEPPDGQAGWRDFILWRVPLDDGHFHSFFVIAPRGEAASGRQPGRFARASGPTEFELGDAIIAGRLRFEEIPDRTLLISVQDYVAQRGQGVIADREHERLGRSDAAIILLRQLWARELRALAAGRPLTSWRPPRRLDTTPGV
jgi:5,5'-dehydrodivanillate O-demethylase